MNKDYTKRFQSEIIKVHIIVTAGCFLCLLFLFLYLDYFYNGAIINVLQDIFGWEFAHFVLRNQTSVTFMVLMIVVVLNSVIVEVYAIQKISRVFSQIKILFQKNEQKIHLDASLSELENDLNALKQESMENEKKALQEVQHKVDMIAYLAHDIKTPLASIIGYLCLLDETNDLPEELRHKYTHITLEKAYRLEKLINEFFDIAKLHQTYTPLHKENIHLLYLLEQMKEEFYPMTTQKNQTIHLEVDEDMLIYADAQKIARVFNNILKNAFHYSDAQTDIVIKGYQDRMYSHILFENIGDTIPQEKLHRIFEQFYRLDQSRNSQTGGSGLGLSIAKTIVEQHHGQIYARSKDRHTVFEVVLLRQEI